MNNSTSQASPASAGLARIHAEWESFGRSDPLWAILTWDGTKDGRWDEETFFRTGVEQVNQSLGELNRRHIAFRTEHALDFGCGVGRLTQGLAHHFRHVTGVDISETMVELARGKNRFGTRISYIASQAPSLPVPDGAIDFVYSFIVLQHMPNEAALSYIRDFSRVLAPGGVAMFQVPSHRTSGRLVYAIKRLLQNHGTFLYDLYWRHVRRATSTMELHALQHSAVEEAIAASGLELVTRMRHDVHAWADYWYVARKPA
jgi:ubiquinone/menaquinone biosynthesis C-methylase UbiE